MKWYVLVLSLWAGASLADQAVLEAVNRERAAASRGALVWDRDLARAAEAHARDMAARGFFSHEGSNGSTLGQRVAASGYRACFAAENIAKGQRSLSEVMAGWMGSTGHRRNILNRKAEAVGLAQGEGRIWVMVLGAPC